MLRQLSVTFTGPRKVTLCEGSLPPPAAGEVQVQTLRSAISAGTELLIYRGEFPEDLTLDENLPGLANAFSYPLKYGYAATGRVVALGAGVDQEWLGRLVFAFHPHESLFNVHPENLQPVPAGLTAEQAVFLPNLETALNLVMDAAPLIGERVVILGQGIVGLLVTSLLARFPLERLLTLDRYPLRRQASLEAGAHASFDPQVPDVQAHIQAKLGQNGPSLADLVFELSGSPYALNQAIALTGYSGRVVIGSWYGKKTAPLDLGGHFHRSRIRLVSSQVSSLDPVLRGRWDKTRRFQLAWSLLSALQPEKWITLRQPVERAQEAYIMLDEAPQEHLGVVLVYPGSEEIE